MKELLQSLNLPKEILDKTEKFLNRLLGPSVDELGQLFGDTMRLRRFKNQIKIFQKSAAIIEKSGLNVRELNLRTLAPLLEFSSLEENESLQEKWSILIANISTDTESGLEPKLAKTLSELSHLEAKILDFFKEKNDEYKKANFERYKDLESYSKRHKTWEDVNVINELSWENVKDEFKITQELTWICLDNLISLGLIKNGPPTIHIYKSKDRLKVDESMGIFSDDKYVNLKDFDITSDSEESENYMLSDYGFYFLRNCNQTPKIK